MSNYIVENHSVKSFQALYNSLKIAGADDAIILMNGHLEIKTDKIDETAVFIAVDNASYGSLINAKAQKISEVMKKSAALASIGVEAFGSGSNVELSESEANSRITAAQFYSQNPTELSESNPYLANALGGGVVTTSSYDDIRNLSLDMKHRLDYIYLNLLDNADGSKSELLLRSMIESANSIEELDAIIDTRV